MPRRHKKKTEGQNKKKVLEHLQLHLHFNGGQRDTKSAKKAARDLDEVRSKHGIVKVLHGEEEFRRFIEGPYDTAEEITGSSAQDRGLSDDEIIARHRREVEAEMAAQEFMDDRVFEDGDFDPLWRYSMPADEYEDFSSSMKGMPVPVCDLDEDILAALRAEGCTWERYILTRYFAYW